jgi:hypothetical protein
MGCGNGIIGRGFDGLGGLGGLGGFDGGCGGCGGFDGGCRRKGRGFDGLGGLGGCGGFDGGCGRGCDRDDKRISVITAIRAVIAKGDGSFDHVGNW